MPTTESLANPRLWLAFAAMTLVGGLANTFPVFLPPLLAEFGGTRAAVTSGISVFWVAAAVSVPVAGRLIDRGDPRRIIGAGLVAAALGTAGAALAPSLGAFSLLVGVGAGIGTGLTGFVTQAAVIAETYRARRGFATGIAFSGSMMGYALATPAHACIELVGWRWTLGVWTVAILVLVPLVWRHYPARLAPRAVVEAAVEAPGVARVVRSLPFWALFVVFTAPPLSGYLMTVQHVLYFEARGFTAAHAATLLLVGGLLSTSGRALAGLIADRVGAGTACVVSWVVSLGGAAILIAFDLVRVPALAYLYVLLVFLPMGSRAIFVSLLASRIAPPGRYASIFGLLAIGNSIGSALGPYLSGAIYDVSGTYLPIYVTAAGVILAALAALTVFLLTVPNKVS